MKSNTHITDLRKLKMLSLYGKPALRIGKRIEFTFWFESWKARFLANFDTTEKCLIGFVQSFYDILQDLGMDVSQFGYMLFPHGNVAFCTK
jgi:hypothetical protein